MVSGSRLKVNLMCFAVNVCVDGTACLSSRPQHWTAESASGRTFLVPHGCQTVVVGLSRSDTGTHSQVKQC